MRLITDAPFGKQDGPRRARASFFVHHRRDGLAVNVQHEILPPHCWHLGHEDGHECFLVSILDLDLRQLLTRCSVHAGLYVGCLPAW
jgi:hypothetical protein